MGPEYGLLWKYDEMPWFDLIILPFVKFLEPDPIPWFPKMSSGRKSLDLLIVKVILKKSCYVLFLGRLVILRWGVFCTFFLFFAQSNLRNILITKSYEKKMINEDDVLLKAQTNGIYVMREIETEFE